MLASANSDDVDADRASRLVGWEDRRDPEWVRGSGVGAMDGKRRVELGAVQETLLIPLYARAKETLRAQPLLVDDKAPELVRSIDYDFTKAADAVGGWAHVLGHEVPHEPLRGVRLKKRRL
jgi:hypothetical protein